jgi:hypothetical protein
VSTAAFNLFIRPKGNGWSTGVAGMVLGKWKMVMVAPHTHFVMAGSHVKRPMFYPRDWDLAFYGILQMHGVHFKQPMFYILEWVLVVYHIL